VFLYHDELKWSDNIHNFYRSLLPLVQILILSFSDSVFAPEMYNLSGGCNYFSVLVCSTFQYGVMITLPAECL
jgi:hypothetical protein